MTDEQKTEGQKSMEAEIPKTNSDTGNKPEATGLVDRAVQAAERLEAANKKSEELVKRQEELFARQMLAGKSELTPKVQKTSLDEANERAKEMIKRYYG